ncbi:MAG: 3'-5' exonuclease [Candidatus Delongbacteria bacterium]|nr:3'-5' exonuclease [Candidatus Delongbacteria bacterium]
MYLFFDTETTGLPIDPKAPTSDFDNWPRIVQLAYLLYDDNGILTASEDFIIKPVGFEIPLESSRIHGITTDRALKEGHQITIVLNKFTEFVQKSNFLVGHNIFFDKKVVGSEYLRNGLEDSLQFKKKICTMTGPTKHFKGWITLSELHQRLFGSNFEEAHNASKDIQATARCFWELRKLGIL